MSHFVLVVHRRREFRERIRRALSALELPLKAARASERVDVMLADGEPDLVVAELGAADDDLLDRLRSLRASATTCGLLAVVEPAGSTAAVEALGTALDDYLLAPPKATELLARSRRLLVNRDLRRRLDLLQVELNRRYGAHRIVCRSSAMEAVYHRVLQLAPTRTTVLVCGESGAGKELVARSLHYNSQRRDHPFLAMNCAAMAETLVENELFGHERGAYTGAVETVPGKFELADGGTLFLDEVGSMGQATQVRLLRVLEEGEFMRVGGRKLIRADVRVVAATNSDLEAQVARGEFRKDLLYRLKVATIEVPPLCRRTDDIPVLARTFVRQLCEENGLAPKELAPETVQRLVRHQWPGNVRELKNLLESLVVTVPERTLRPDHLPPDFARAAAVMPTSPPEVGMTLAAAERHLIAATLRAHDGNRTRAARVLGIGLRTLQRKIKLHAIDVPYRPSSGPREPTPA